MEAAAARASQPACVLRARMHTCRRGRERARVHGCRRGWEREGEEAGPGMGARCKPGLPFFALWVDDSRSIAVDYEIDCSRLTSPTAVALIACPSHSR